MYGHQNVQLNVEFEISLDIVVATGEHDERLERIRKGRTGSISTCCGFGATVICLYPESTCFSLYLISFVKIDNYR